MDLALAMVKGAQGFCRLGVPLRPDVEGAARNTVRPLGQR